jgi:hypothetical protein
MPWKITVRADGKRANGRDCASLGAAKAWGRVLVDSVMFDHPDAKVECEIFDPEERLYTRSSVDPSKKHAPLIWRGVDQEEIRGKA